MTITPLNVNRYGRAIPSSPKAAGLNARPEHVRIVAPPARRF